MAFLPLSQMLEALLLGSDELDAEVSLAESSALTYATSQVLGDEYSQRYAAAVQGVVEAFGEPAFLGNQETPCFPTELGCREVTCWDRPQGTVYVGLAADREGIRLVAGCRRSQPTDQAEAITIPPPEA